MLLSFMPSPSLDKYTKLFTFVTPKIKSMSEKDRYALRGVSAQKEDVHGAIRELDHGLFPKAFCKIYPDLWAGSPEHCTIMHADGAGTKSILAYLYWKETGDVSVWKGISIDAIVMNLDDMLCVGATGPFTYSSTIGRNKNLIPAEVLERLINGTQEFFDQLKEYDVDITLMGGETADVGDVVRTAIVDGTMACRMRRDEVIDAQNVQVGDVIVSFASYGKAIYEEEYNSGIGSNGLTSARHEVLNHSYAENYPEAYDPAVPKEVVYNGKYTLTDEGAEGLNIGKLLLSPTRTYAPLIIAMLKEHRQNIRGIIHCSGGGQTKCMHYMPEGVHVIKDNLLEVPPIFKMIQESAGTDWKEMYEVFNMGQRLEVFTDAKTADALVALSKTFGIDAQVSGRVEASKQDGKNHLTITGPYGTYEY